MLAGMVFFKTFAKYLVATRNVRLCSDRINPPRNDVRKSRYYYRTLTHSRLYYLLCCRLGLRQDRTGAFATETSELFTALIRTFTIIAQAKLDFIHYIRDKKGKMDWQCTVELSTPSTGTVFTVCMYGHTYRKGMDQPGMVANPARGQLNRKNSQVFCVRFEYLDRSKSEGSSGSLRS